MVEMEQKFCQASMAPLPTETAPFILMEAVDQDLKYLCPGRSPPSFKINRLILAHQSSMDIKVHASLLSRLHKNVFSLLLLQAFRIADVLFPMQISFYSA